MVRNEIQPMHKSIEQLQKRIKDIADTLNHQQVKIGNVFEIAARAEIAKRHGSRFAEPFKVFDLYGLLRLALPKTSLADEKDCNQDTAGLLEMRAIAVAKHIDQKKLNDALTMRIDTINKWVEEKINSKPTFCTELKTVLEQLCQYVSNWKETKDGPLLAHQYIAHTKGLAVACLSTLVFAHDADISKLVPVRTELDVDVRGAVTRTENAIMVTLGEIKSTMSVENIKKAKQQLYITCAFLANTLELLRQEYKQLPPVEFIGIVFVPNSSGQIDTDAEDFKQGITTLPDNSSIQIVVECI
ncbi:hypothetical protein EMCRGX_G006482 [Ephydatia muelleri]